MSRTSLLRPEWISEHLVHNGVSDISPWAFNHGHFEHQMTYFIGPVNFHWVSNGRKYVRQMNTGDANYITPFVPHTFTTRINGQGVILAVTYGGAIATEFYQSKIQQLSLDGYLSQSESKIPYINGVLPTDELGGIMINHHRDAKVTGSGAIKELMGSIPFQPHSRALEYVVDDGKPELSGIKAGAERWGYNIGNTPVIMEWASHSVNLNPEDSFFIRRGVEHSLRGKGKIVVMETNPESSNPLEELALIKRYSGRKGLERVHTENTQWF
jgi:hypothetical protein